MSITFWGHLKIFTCCIKAMFPDCIVSLLIILCGNYYVSVSTYAFFTFLSTQHMKTEIKTLTENFS